MILRLLIVLLCYLFSVFGLMFSIQISIEELRRISWSNIVVFVWALCWGLHLYMSLCWIVNKKINAMVAKTSLASLVASLLYGPIYGFFGAGTLMSNIYGSVFILVLEVLFTFPVIVLAIYLYYFNLSAISTKIKTGS